MNIKHFEAFFFVIFCQFHVVVLLLFIESVITKAGVLFIFPGGDVLFTYSAEWGKIYPKVQCCQVRAMEVTLIFILTRLHIVAAMHVEFLQTASSLMIEP